MKTKTPHSTAKQVLVIVDHHEASVFTSIQSDATPVKMVPYDPEGHRTHLHSRNEDTDGKRQPVQKSYYEAIAAAIHDADQILIFGSGTGESSAMDSLVADLHSNHVDLAGRVVGTERINGHHDTPKELLSKARDYFEKLEAVVVTQVHNNPRST
jgi:hypothetical protein